MKKIFTFLLATFILIGAACNFVQGQTSKGIIENGKTDKRGENMALIVRKSGLYAVDLLFGTETCIDSDARISMAYKDEAVEKLYEEREYHLDFADDNKTVAYVKNGSLYIGFIELSESPAAPILICDNVRDFIFLDNLLIYSPKDGGLFTYSLAEKEVSIISSSEDYYYWMVTSKDKLYASKEHTYTKPGLTGTYVKMSGIVEISIKAGTEEVVIPEIPIDDEGDLGEYYRTIGTSANGHYLYVIRGPHSGSISADGVALGVYDILSKEFIPSEIGETLPYRENFAINPIKNGEIAYMHGTSREMTYSKDLALLEPATDKFTQLTDGSIVIMHPDFSCDGSKIVFSAGASGTVLQGEFHIYGDKDSIIYENSHSILEYDVNTGNIATITDKGFNIRPKYITDGKAISFIRENGEAFDLYVYENGSERLAATDICSKDSYYGYYNMEPVINIK